MKKRIYLTIDDAPSRHFREKVDFLSKKQIPAIFFCVGKSIEERKRDLIYAIKKGFVIGNHSFSHRDFSQIPINEVKEEIVKTDKLIAGLYKAANKKRPFKLFRFPYGSKGNKNKKTIQKILGNLGYKQPNFNNINYFYFKELGLDKDLDVFWTFDFLEYSLTWKKILEKINKKHPKQGGSLQTLNSSDITLIHDHANTNNLFFKIIDELIKRGLIFEDIK